jgi:hypothetical protein
MNYALVPDADPDGRKRPPRLIRFVEAGKLGANVLSYYDEEKNLLRIDRKLFATLSYDQQRMVERTHEQRLVLGDPDTATLLEQIDLFDRWTDWPEEVAEAAE